MAQSMLTESDSGNGMSTRTLAYAIIPLVVVFVISLLLLFLYRRRRRRLHPEEPYMFGRDRILTPGGHLVYSAGGRRNRHGRWAPWSGTRSNEGLNELGEAPPPYKKDEELQAGQRPPEYLTECGIELPTRPEAAVLRDMEGQRPGTANTGTQTHGLATDRRASSVSHPIVESRPNQHGEQEASILGPAEGKDDCVRRSDGVEPSPESTSMARPALATLTQDEIGESSGRHR